MHYPAFIAMVCCVPAHPGSLVTGGALGASSHSCILPVAFWGRALATDLVGRLIMQHDTDVLAVVTRCLWGLESMWPPRALGTEDCPVQETLLLLVQLLPWTGDREG